ncbi:hypothetical protein ACOME3_007807 [Neoechinorhynchus agilis]
MTLNLITNQVIYSFCYTFPFSMRPKTHSYHCMNDDVSHELKLRRNNEVHEAFRSRALVFNQSLINTNHLVLVEGISPRCPTELVGRNDFNTRVNFSLNEQITKQNIKEGDYVVVRLTAATSQSLRGEILRKVTTISEFQKEFSS